MDSNQVAKSLSNDVLKTVYSMGAYNKEQLFKILAAKKIQSWYRKKLRDANQKDEGEGFSMAGVLRERNTTMSLQIRMILKEYTQSMLMGYPNFAMNKIGIQEPFMGTKKSDVVKWIITNMNKQQMNYVGF